MNRHEIANLINQQSIDRSQLYQLIHLQRNNDKQAEEINSFNIFHLLIYPNLLFECSRYRFSQPDRDFTMLLNLGHDLPSATNYCRW